MTPASGRVEVVIAVHTPRRPTARAVASVLAGNADHARVTVVAHNTDPDAIAATLPPEHRRRVRLLEHRDGVPSPAGPFNAGMRAARGEFVSLLGSDDRLQPGAIASWLALADAHRAETVVARLALGRPARIVPTPPTRPRLRGLADPVRDRLAYRSAPLGLVSLAARERLGAELLEGAVVGEDLPYVTRLWVETAVAVDRAGPPYLVGDDAGDRTTYAARPLALEHAALRHLLAAPYFAAYPARVRRSVAVKAIRVHLFGAVLQRPDPATWTPSERTELAATARALLGAAPGTADVLSLADAALLRAIRSRRADAAEMVALAHARRRHGRPSTLATANPARLLDVEAPLRLMAASVLTR